MVAHPHDFLQSPKIAQLLLAAHATVAEEDWPPITGEDLPSESLEIGTSSVYINPWHKHAFKEKLGSRKIRVSKNWGFEIRVEF